MQEEVQKKENKRMIEDDTIKLLRECDAGVKMGISSIDDVIEYVSEEDFRKDLKECRNQHIKLKDEMLDLLREYGDTGKEWQRECPG